MNCRLCGRVSSQLDSDGYCEFENSEETLSDSQECEIARERAQDEQRDYFDLVDEAYMQWKDK